MQELNQTDSCITLLMTKLAIPFLALDLQLTIASLVTHAWRNFGGKMAIAKGLSWLLKLWPILIILPGAHLIARSNFLLFHGLTELLCTLVAFGIFVVIINNRRHIEESSLLLLGVAYLFVGLLDLLHMFAYKGVGILQAEGANLATQLWIAARLLEAGSILTGSMLVLKPRAIPPLVFMYSIVTAGILVSIFAFNIFPVCFIDGKGLTVFKVAAEWLVIIMLGASAILYHNKRESCGPEVHRLLIAAIIVSMISEFLFTAYVGVYDWVNQAGHLSKLLSFYLIYKAIIEMGLTRPVNLLVNNLKESREELKAERDRLQEALDELQVLKGIIPICSSCKKIRGDEGSWTQLEVYLHEHSAAEFSHGICPDCVDKLYPDLLD